MRTLLLCLVAIAAVVPISVAQPPLEQAERAYFENLALAEANYRKALAAALGGADKVELFVLDFEPQRSSKAEFSRWDVRLPEGFFPIVPYRSQSRILGGKTLSEDERRLVLPPLQAAVAVEKNNGGAMCHFPIHGIRAWVGEEILFQTSLCWHCSNFYVKYPTGDAQWIGLADRKLQAICERLLPIPQEEIERFNATYNASSDESDAKMKRSRKGPNSGRGGAGGLRR